MCYLCQAVSSDNLPYTVPGSTLFGGGIVTQYVGAVPDTGNQLTDGLASWTRQLPIGQAINVKYTFDNPANFPSYNYGPPTPFNAAQRANTLIAMEKFSEVANITWTENNSSWNLDFSVEILDPTPQNGGVRGVTWFSLSSQAVMSNPTHIAMDTAPGMGDFVYGAPAFGWYALIHEIGHAMGMKHPFDVEYGSGGTSDPETPVYMQNAGWTVMSYADGSQVARSEVRSLMPGDILAMQLLYGKNMSTGAGDTTYDLASATWSGARGLWDASGSDVFLAANAAGSATIDLRKDIGDSSGLRLNKVPLIGGGTSKVIITDADIEHAIGGGYGDTMIGNDLNNYIYGGGGNDSINGSGGNDALFGGHDVSSSNSGHDVILGGKGNDIIFGNDGNDVLYGGDGVNDNSGSTNNKDTVFGGLGDDTIYGGQDSDYIIGAAGNDVLYPGLGADIIVITPGNQIDSILGFESHDVIKLYANANSTQIDTFAEILQNTTTDGTHLFINLGANNGLFMAWMTPNQLQADDFWFVAQGAPLVA